MLTNIFKVAFRNLFKNKLFTIINIVGLAIGLAAFVLISTFIKNEYSFDEFHAKGDRIYRPVEIQKPPGVPVQHVAVTMGPLAAAMQADFPEVEQATSVMGVGTGYFQYGDERNYEASFIATDSAFFDIFTLTFLHGNPQTALSNPDGLIINREMAEKYFPDENPLGKIVQVDNWADSWTLKITGVIEDYPENSHLRFRAIVSIKPYKERNGWLRSWTSNSLATYVALKPDSDPDALDSKFPAFIEKYVPKQAWSEGLEMYLQPLREIHLQSNHMRFQTFNSKQGSLILVQVFTAIAILVLLIACINFMNLSTARATKRAKEVGIRKVLGTQRQVLIYQFLGESLLIAFLALILGVGLVLLATPLFQELSGNRLLLSFYDYPTFLPELAIVTLITALIAGSYPAFFLSSYQPIETIKGKANRSGSTGSTRLRKLLVVSQFVVAITLIITTGVIIDQMQFIDNKDLGFDKEQLVSVPLRGDMEPIVVERLRNQISEHAGVRGVSASSGRFGASGSQSIRQIAGEDAKSIMMRIGYVDYDFIETMKIDMVAGRSFSKEFATDSVAAAIINETAAKELGWEEPLGKAFANRGGQDIMVIGVVRDYHYNKMTQKIEPMILTINPDRFDFLLVRAETRSMQEIIDHISGVWDNNVDRPFDYAFLDEYYARMYEDEANSGKLFAAFSALAVFIACLGLFGLISYTTEQKIKEIGIRKVLGASVPGIVSRLCSDMIKWILVAGILAFPLGYFAVDNWLNNFEYRTSIEWSTFLLSVLIVAIVALLTVGYQATRAALANPVEALKHQG